jgi:hypothetical protein
MRKMAFVLGLAMSLPAMAGASVDGGTSVEAPPRVADGEQAGHTGSSLDPNGNMGNVGRTGKKDAAADAATNEGAEGASGSNPPDEDHEPAAPFSGQSAPPP